MAPWDHPGQTKKNLRQALAEEIIADHSLSPDHITPGFVSINLREIVKQRVQKITQASALGRIACDIPPLAMTHSGIWVESLEDATGSTKSDIFDALASFTQDLYGNAPINSRMAIAAFATFGVILRIIAILNPEWSRQRN